MTEAARSSAPTLIALGDDRVVVKRGLVEVALGGNGVASDAKAVVDLLQAGHTPDEVLDAVPVPVRARAESILQALRRRGMLEEHAALDDTRLDARQRAAYREFGRRGAAAADRLSTAVVLLIGANALGRAAARDLLDSGVGEVRVVADDRLDAPDADAGWPRDGRLRRSGDISAALEGAGLLCALSEAGEVEALYDANRVALAAERPSLPAWIDALVAHIGPLTYGFETACLRCYRLRADANDGHRDVAAAVRRHVSDDPMARAQLGALAPMISMAGAVVAMEALKALTELAPSDAVSRHVELNLIAFSSRVRRVLKLPRCPDCGGGMRVKPTVLVTGPRIPVPAHRHGDQTA